MASIERVLVLGAGWVGRQVAARMARYGVTVWLVDRQTDVCQAALAWMQQLDHFDADPQWLQRVHIAGSIQELSASEQSIDLVLESVPEQLSLKKRVLRQASELFSAPTIIASNSSYFVPSVLSEFVADSSRFAHWHFHIPVLNDSVVDIVGCEATNKEVLDRLQELTLRIGQIPLMLRREHPGYVFNWLLQSVLKSALELAALDVADPIDIDRSWTAVTGMPLGPFAIMDRIGLDVIEQVLSNSRWAEPTTVPVDELLALLSQHTSQGEFGEKTGRGFYAYTLHPSSSNVGHVGL